MASRWEQVYPSCALPIDPLAIAMRFRTLHHGADVRNRIAFDAHPALQAGEGHIRQRHWVRPTPTTPRATWKLR